MTVSRRNLLLTASISGSMFAMPSLARAGLASQATPEGTPADESLTPEAIYESLLASTISSPLFPADTGELVVIGWNDTGDDDLQGVVGGLLVQAGEGEDAPLTGVYIVHPSVDLARSRIESRLDGTGEFSGPFEMFGYSGAWQHDPGDPTGHIVEEDSSYSLVALVVGTVIVSAVGDGGPRDANSFRALANLAGMLDHLRMTTT
jgi:hypothetical protein